MLPNVKIISAENNSMYSVCESVWNYETEDKACHVTHTHTQTHEMYSETLKEFNERERKRKNDIKIYNHYRRITYIFEFLALVSRAEQATYKQSTKCGGFFWYRESRRIRDKICTATVAFRASFFRALSSLPLQYRTFWFIDNCSPLNKMGEREKEKWKRGGRDNVRSTRYRGKETRTIGFSECVLGATLTTVEIFRLASFRLR